VSYCSTALFKAAGHDVLNVSAAGHDAHTAMAADHDCMSLILLPYGSRMA
jgi:hypothetical protein